MVKKNVTLLRHSVSRGIANEPKHTGNDRERQLITKLSAKTCNRNAILSSSHSIAYACVSVGAPPPRPVDFQ